MEVLSDIEVFSLGICSFVCVLFNSYNNKIYQKMFDTEDSDSSGDDETFAWIDQYPDLALNVRTFRYLQQGAVAHVLTCITQDNDVAAHAKDTLAKILRMCSRDEVESIRNVDDARDLITQKQLILEQAERFGREQREVRDEQRSEYMAGYMREYNRGEERRRSERIREQGRQPRQRSGYMGTYQANMTQE